MPSTIATSVCALIVTWNPDRNDLQNSLQTLVTQVQEIIIVDNGSLPEHLGALKEIISAFPHVTLLEHSKNRGLAAGLNTGVNYAMEKGYAWILILDHDSVAESSMVHTMLSAYHALPKGEQSHIGIVAPNFTTLKGLVYPAVHHILVPTTITSGQLIKTELFKTIGFFEEKLFIEGIDHDFCFKALAQGMKTLLVPDAILHQKIGNPALGSFLGKKFVIAHHAPSRYYYLYRNSVYLYFHYFSLVPRWTLRNMLTNVLVFGKVVLFEKQKMQKIIMIVRGIIDGCANRFGKLPA